MKSFKLRGAAVLAGLSLFAAGCGGGDDEAATSADLSGQTLEVAAVWSGTEQERFQSVLDEFETRTGATVTFTSTGDDIAATLTPRIAAGDAPDVAVLPQPGLLNDLASAGSLKALGPDVQSAVKDNYSQDWQDLGSVDNTPYGVWFKAANKSTVWYDTADFENAGVEAPESWDDLLTTSQTLADSGVSPVSVGGADGWTLTDWFENVYLRTAGAEKYDQLSKHEIPWTDPSVTTALNTLAELWGKPEFLAGGTQGALQADFPTSVQKVFSDNGNAAMVYEGDFVAGVITDDLGKTVGTDANFFDFPSVDDSAPSVVGGGDVAVMLNDNPAAQELMEFLASPDAAEVWAKQGGYLSPNKNVDSGVYPDEVTQRLAEGLTNAETFRFDMSDLAPAAFGGTVGQGEWKLLQDFLTTPTNVQGTQTALEAAAAAAWPAS